MRGETQALHLAKMMQNYKATDSYELALPLVTVRRSKLKKLQLNDVLLLRLKVLEFVLIEGETICAKMLLKTVNDVETLALVSKERKIVKTSDSNKYEVLKLSLGMCQMKSLTIDEDLDMAEINIDNIRLMLGEKKLAEGSLVTIDNEIAVKINKVMI